MGYGANTELLDQRCPDLSSMTSSLVLVLGVASLAAIHTLWSP